MDKRKCESCVRANEEVEAILWCNDCSEELCGTCGKVHRRFASPHDVVNLQDVSEVCRSITKTCKNHVGTPLNIFCIEHNAILCHQCLTEYHNKCTKILPIEKASSGIKDGDKIQTLKSSMESLKSFAEDVNKRNLDRGSKLENEKCILLDQITKIKSTINETLDRETNRVISKYHEFKIETSKVDLTLRAIQDTLEANIKALDQVKKSSTESHIFHAVNLFDDTRTKYERQVALSRREIDFRILTRMPASFHTTLADFLHSFQLTVLPKPTENLTQAQVSSFNCDLTQWSEIFKPVPFGKFYLGCFANDDRIILLEHGDKDNRNKLKFCIIQRKSGKTDKIPISSCDTPNYVTSYQKDYALVTWKKNIDISVVDIRQLQLGREIRPNFRTLTGYSGFRTKECSFIYDIGGEIWVCIQYDSNAENLAFICNIDFNGEILRYFPVDPNVASMCFNWQDKVFIYTHRISNTIFSLSMKGDKKTYYSSIDLRAGCTITSCRDGIVIYESETNTIYTTRGCDRTFAFKIGKMSHFHVLHFDTRTNKLLVVELESAKLYNI